ncbi:MAG: TetR/AcrR family transcriptional regulator [Amphiplicatus sp.]
MTTPTAALANLEDEKEAAIIEAARKTFLTRGFEAASMDAIALRAGVSKRTVYNRFRSKEALFAAAINKTCQRILPVNVEAIEASLPPEQFIREMASLFVHGVLDPEALALKRIAMFEATRKPALGKAYLAHGPRFMAEACAPMLTRLAARGALKVDDPMTAIYQLGALITEPLYTEVLMGDPPADLDAAIAAQIDMGVKAFMKLYGA